jgi:hypothetical protein
MPKCLQYQSASFRGSWQLMAGWSIDWNGIVNPERGVYAESKDLAKESVKLGLQSKF